MLLVDFDPTSLALVGGRRCDDVAEGLGTDFAVGGSAVGDWQQLVTFMTHECLDPSTRLRLEKKKSEVG